MTAMADDAPERESAGKLRRNAPREGVVVT